MDSRVEHAWCAVGGLGAASKEATVAGVKEQRWEAL